MNLTIPKYWHILQDKILLVRMVLKLKPFDTSTEEGRSKERYRRVALTAAGSVVSKGVTILTGLISVPLTVHYLGVERYGLWMTISSVVAFLSFADFGLGNGLLNAISKADGEDSTEEATVAISSAFFMLLVVSVMILALFMSAYPFVNWGRVFNVTSEIANREAGPAVAILVLTFLINMPLGVIQRIQMGYQEGYLSQLWLSVGAILGLFGVLIVIYFKAGLPWLVLAISGGPLLSTIINGFHLFASKPHFLPNWNYFNLSASKKLVGVGIVFFLLQIFTLVGNSADNIVIAQILGASAVASYAVTKKVFMTVQISQYIIQPLWPAFGEAIAREDYAWARRALIRMLKFSLIAGAIISFPLVLFGKSIIYYWVGPHLVPSLAVLLAFFFWVFLVNYGGTMSVFLNNGALLKKQCLFIGAAALSSVVLQIVFIRLIGVSGAVWGILAGYGLFYALPAYRLAFGYLNRIGEEVHP